MGDERGRIAQLIFGEPTKNYENAKQELCLLAGLHLYNRWKASARDNLAALIEHIGDEDASSYLLKPVDIKDVKGLLGAMSNTDSVFVSYLKSRFTFEGKKLFDSEFIEEKAAGFLLSELISELNLILEGPSLFDKEKLSGQNLSDYTQQLLEGDQERSIQLNRRLLEDSLWSYIDRKSDLDSIVSEQDRTILDVVLDEDIRDDFVTECQNLITFSAVYDNLIADLVSVARQAHESKTLSAEFIEHLLQRSFAEVAALGSLSEVNEADIKSQFISWVDTLANHARCSAFLKSAEEWIRVVHKDKSDTLFVIVSFFFEKILPEYYSSQASGKKFDGRVEPVRIGRRKDFWNRLTIAYLIKFTQDGDKLITANTC